MERARAATSLDPQFGRVVCLGWATATAGDEEDEDSWGFAFGAPSVVCGDEREVLEQAQRLFDTAKTAIVVGHNVAFDLRFLTCAMLRHGMRVPWALRRATRTAMKQGEWRDRELLCDTQQVPFSAKPGTDFGPSLRAVARLLGLPLQQTPPGSEVARLWAAGDRSAIAAHCAEDVALTGAVYSRLSELGWLS